MKGAIEVGTTGMSREQARRVKEMYYRALDAATAGTNIRRFELRTEPIDAVAMNGAAAKRFGTPALAQVSLQVELPLSGDAACAGQRDVQEGAERLHSRCDCLLEYAVTHYLSTKKHGRVRIARH